MALVEKSYRDGEIIVKEGEAGTSFFKLLEGKARVYSNYEKKDQLEIAVLKAGEFFGEMAIIEEYPRSATVVASSNVSVIEIPGDEMNAYFASNPDEIIELMRHLGGRVQTMMNDYNDSKALLNRLRESDGGKKDKSLLGKIKKHINAYNYNKNKIEAPGNDTYNESFAEIADDSTGTMVTYEKGMNIYRAGEAGDCLYILRRGKIGLYADYGGKNEEKISDLTAVNIIGEMGLINNEPRTETAIAETDDTCVEIICEQDLGMIFSDCPAKIDMIFKHLSNRLRKLTVDFLYVCKEITEIYSEK